jgi:hypothetical protein
VSTGPHRCPQWLNTLPLIAVSCPVSPASHRHRTGSATRCAVGSDSVQRREPSPDSRRRQQQTRSEDRSPTPTR